ncbi:MAG: winged helix-turn-helix domain-containing protein [Proteobacteria bacterium]|nr:winged helix-turn-helix domain-containing protein [Pseudomonadota bacterium]
MKSLTILTLGFDPASYRLISDAVAVPIMQISGLEALEQSAQDFEALAIFVDASICDPKILQALPQKALTLWRYVALIGAYEYNNEGQMEALIAAGFHDAIQKPLRCREVLARLQARFRDASRLKKSNEYSLGDITINPAYRMIRKNGVERQLTPCAFGVLHELSQFPDKTVSRELILKAVWRNSHVNENSLERQINGLRKTLKDLRSSLVIKSEYGKGFKILSEPLPAHETLRDSINP